MKSSVTSIVVSCVALFASSEFQAALAQQQLTVARDNNITMTVHDNSSSSSTVLIVGDAPVQATVPPNPTRIDSPSDVPSISNNTGSVDPSAGAVPPPASLIDHTDAMRNFAPPKYIDTSAIKNRAIPTNNWWGNMIAFDKSTAIQPVWSNPYALQVVADKAPYGLAVSYPHRSRVSGGSSGNKNAIRYYAHGIVHEFMFSAAEFSAKPTFQVVDWADIGVKVQLKSGSATMESNLVSGMPYVSARYSGGLSPKLVSVASIQSVNGQSPGTITGSKFEIVYNSGQKWVLYSLGADGQSEKPITLTVEGGSTLKSTGAFDGLLRVALAVDSAWVPTLDKYKSCVVESASVAIESDTSYAFNWKTSGNCANGLLHYAMKHQALTIDTSTASTVDGMVAQSSTRGGFQALVTSGSSTSWKFKETQEVAEDFYPSRKIPSSVVAEQRIVDHLKSDIQSDWSIPVGGSYYFNGKAAQKYASLCLMANDPSIVGQDKSLLSTCLSKLRTVMMPFVSNSWTNKLQYDLVYGGIVSSEGFKKNDLGADFGNTMYNDHHFHYGYWLYTSAIINYLDPSWSELPRLNTMANLLARDVANFDTNDQFFPRFRSFDWFRGHSYSHGVTPFADGKDQESTSEDINFSFGLYLLGKTTNNQAMATVGKLMARVNAHAIRTYFLIEDANQIHPTNFRPNKVTGIFFDNKVDYATWFSADKHCIHGIQMIPISPMTEFVRTKQFVKEEWDEVLGKTPIVIKEDTSNSWLSLLYANYAVVNKQRAMSVLQKTKMDDGLTRAWALYMAASTQ